MATSTPTPQQGGSSVPTQQQGQTGRPPVQAGQPIFKDWASI